MLKGTSLTPYNFRGDAIGVAPIFLKEKRSIS